MSDDQEIAELWQMKNEYMTCIDIYNSRTLLNTDNKHVDAIFTKFLINLSDILQFLSNKNHRIDFNNDIPGKETDVTDLITKCRNAACHIRSGENRVGNNSAFTFNRMFGKGVGVKIGGFEFASEYEDDVAIGYGTKRLYLVRHLKVVLEEIPNRLEGIDVLRSKVVE